jgi:hypothetical protein
MKKFQLVQILACPSISFHWLLTLCLLQSLNFSEHTITDCCVNQTPQCTYLTVYLSVTFPIGHNTSQSCLQGKFLSGLQRWGKLLPFTKVRRTIYDSTVCYVTKEVTLPFQSQLVRISKFLGRYFPNSRSMRLKENIQYTRYSEETGGSGLFWDTIPAMVQRWAAGCMIGYLCHGRGWEFFSPSQ